MISPKWRALATGFLGVPDGRHCHWCEHMVSEEGEVTCGNNRSKVDGRIRSWDGEQCAKECKVFKLSEWYTKDENHDAYFHTKPTAQQENKS